MSAWRVILTDSDGESGVAPICDSPDHARFHHASGPSDPWVYDCCRGPHLECGTGSVARVLAAALTAASVEVCP